MPIKRNYSLTMCLFPYSTLQVSKTTETEPNLLKDINVKIHASRNIGTVKITGFTYSNNAVLQALKNEARDFDEFETLHTLVFQKGTILEGDIIDRTIKVTGDNLVLYNNSIKMILGTDYSVLGGVITYLTKISLWKI